MAEIKWIKIVTDIFDDEKIRLIEKMPEADSLIVIWFKILCLAGKTNKSGLLVLSDKIYYTDEMLSSLFNRPLNIIRLALDIFQRFGMIEILNNAYYVANWEKHQNVESMERIKEQNRLRKQRQRSKEKLIPENIKVTQKSRDRHATDKDIDKEEDKNKNKKVIYIVEIIDYLNQKAGTTYRANSQKTKTLIEARIKEGFTINDFKTVIDKKVTAWSRDEKMAKFLRPETLFGTKFEGYLNERTAKNVPRAFASLMEYAEEGGEYGQAGSYEIIDVSGEQFS